MSWIDHTIWWHVYPLGFSGAVPAGPEPGRGLRSLIDWLDYARDLGANGLALGPICESVNHGYDTLDFLTLDRRLGTEADFVALAEACHERGFKLMLDGVFNHVAREHPWLQRALAEGPGSQYADLFAIDWTTPEPSLRLFEGHPELVELNHDSPQVAALIRDVMNHWLDRGADAWRLDAAYAVPPKFWRSVLPAVRERHPQAWFVGEVIHGDYAAYVRDSNLDAVTQYELWKASWSSLADENFFEIDWSLQRHNDFLDRFTPMTFIGNHDVTRVATAAGLDRVVLALAILMTCGGVPSIYYGDEQGLTGLKEERIGGDDVIRPPFPPQPGDLPPGGQWLYRAHQDLIGLRRRHPWLVQARTTPVELTASHYVYASRSREGQELIVELSLDPLPKVEIRASTGNVLYTWSSTEQ
ncbi:MAG: alpha-amylase family protein [Propionibacteriaceae bacterium]|jgi:glycosidase|nr:alpha-amylase family protein [Propionibacteriaceae bacterium]